MLVTQLDKSLQGKLLKDLESQGFEIRHPPYTVFQGIKKGISCTLYTSGKLVIQGSASPEFIEFYIEPELLGTFDYKYDTKDFDPTPRIGVDESGKGDFFGPLCIAGVYAGPKELETLLKIGVKDSKTLTPQAILKMAAAIRASVPHHVVRISPSKYNALYSQFANLNLLLAWGHATVIEALSLETGCKRALIDQFTHLPLVENALKKKALVLEFSKKTKGESDPVVAAASILARAAFVDGLEQLSKKIGLELPKGASKQVVQTGQKLVRERGQLFLKEVAKTHFKTFDEILRNVGESKL
jgi:ribonuclease HIII